MIISWRNQPDRRSRASWAPPLIAAPRLPYAAIDTMIIVEASPDSDSPPYMAEKTRYSVTGMMTVNTTKVTFLAVSEALCSA